MVPVEIEVEKGTTYTLVRVSGELELATSPQLQEALASLDAEDWPIVLDLSEVTFLDSSALRVLVQTRLRLDNREELRLVVPRPPLRRIFEISGLADDFLLCEQLDEATQGL